MKHQNGMTDSSENTNASNKTSCSTFEDLYDLGAIGLSTLKFINAKGFLKASPVQEAVIPVLMQKMQDVAVEACTGSGKTLAFLIPIVEILLQSRGGQWLSTKGICYIGAVCLGPTRELVIQIHNVLNDYLKFVNDELSERGPLISSLLFTGGNNIERDVALIQSSSNFSNQKVIVATPGRLSHLLETVRLNQDWTFRELEVLIFDEADRLLLDGASFESQLSTILSVLPKQRRTGLFSATLSNEMRGLIKAGMRNPTLIQVIINKKLTTNHLASGNEGVEHTDSNSDDQINDSQDCSQLNVSRSRPSLPGAEIFPRPSFKGSCQSKGKKCILFFLTCSCVNIVHKLLFEVKRQKLCPWLAEDVTIERLFGKMNQKSRISSINRFSKSSPEKGALLIATDIAARGLDFPDVEWILQFDAPLDPSMYIHRIGRTARAGRSGDSLLFICPPEEACIPFLRNRQVPLKSIDVHPNLLMRIEKLSLSEVFTVPLRGGDLCGLDECPLDTISSNEITTVPYEDFKRQWEIFRCLLVSDRDIALKASAAFVSFIRAYKEHQLQFIFPFRDLEMGQFASSLALLRIPRVREILGKSIKDFSQSHIIPQSIPFKDAHKEIEYELTRKRKEEAKPQDKRTRKEQKLVAGEQAQKTSETTTTDVTKYRSRSEKRRAKKRRCEEEWNELALEERLYKKLRRGQITEQEYESRLTGADGEDDVQLPDDGCVRSEIQDKGSDTENEEQFGGRKSGHCKLRRTTKVNNRANNIAKWIKTRRKSGKKKK